MIQLALAMVLLSAWAASDLVKQSEKLADSKALSVATGLDVTRNGGNDYLATYYDSIKGGKPITLPTGGTVADNLKPTIDELRKLGKVPLGSTGKSLIASGNYKLFISGNPSGCSMADPACNLDGLVCIDAPLKKRTKVDYARLGLAARKIGADGAYSTREAPTVVTGLGGTWSTTNPITGISGILCARFGYSASSFSPFVRKDGSVAMTGNFNVGGQSIINAKDVTSTGTVKGGQFLTDIKTVGSACSDLGALASGNGVGMVCDGTKWQIDDGKRAAAGTACAPDGSTATSTATGELLVCKNGKYVKLVSLLGKKVLIGSALVKDGDVVTMPVCDVGGTPDFSFDATQVTLDLTTNPPKQTMYWTAVNASASTWAVKIRLKDNTGAEASGNTVGLTNIMNLECRY